jgi:23S rRNA pseudouridine1911/1915/1917 synthase
MARFSGINFNVPETLFIVDAYATRTRLDEFLTQQLTALSRLHIRRLCEAGAVSVNGIAQRGGYRVATGQQVAVEMPELLPNSMTPEALPLDIAHETASFLVVNKPAGMLVHPTLTVKTGTLLNGLAHYLNRTPNAAFIRPGLVHRLDRETSGLIAVAKTQRALSILTRHWQEHRVAKLYLALTHGVIAPDEILIDAPIGRDEDERPFWRVLATGRQAQTRLLVLERQANHTFVELEPITGRTNQLRIHCAHLGHPIVGDKLHGRPEDAAPRLCLHAAQLAFHDPDTGIWQEFRAPWPIEFSH